MKKRLSDPTIARLRAPATGRLEICDDLVSGLMLRVTTNGVKSFSVSYKVAGEGGFSKTGRPLVGSAHRITLGRYPFIKTKAARDAARLIVAEASEGINPQTARFEKHKERRANSLAEVSHRFIELDCKPTVESWRRIERTLEIHVLPTLGDTPIQKIGKADVHTLLDGIAKGTGKGAAAGVLKHLHRLFEFARDREIIDRNPAHKLKRRDLKPNKNARRSLTNEEIRSIWNAADLLGYPIGPWIKLTILTGARRAEWAEATRGEIDVERRCQEIPEHRYKSRKPHVVPLGDVAWEIVAGLPTLGGGEYLFSTDVGRRAINSWSRAKNKVDALAPTDWPWTFHDFRSTCKTRLAALGISQEHRNACMGHAQAPLDEIYNKHDYLDSKRAALDTYATHLMGIVK